MVAVTVTPTGSVSPLPNGALNFAWEFATKALAEAAHLPATLLLFRTGGCSSLGDGGEGLYKRVNAQPSHAGKIQTADGAWWELAEDEPNPMQFGAVGGGVANDSVAFQATIAYALATGRKLIRVPDVSGGYRMTSKLTVVNASSLRFVGSGTRYMANSPVFIDPASSDDCLFELTEANDIIFERLTLKGHGASASGTYLIKCTDENADCDVEIDGCHVGNVETLIQMKGRGLVITNTSIVQVTHGVELAWPSPFTPGGNTDHTLQSGMRAYRLTNLRCHAWSGGYLFKNEGSNKSNFHGALISDIYADTNMRIWKGSMRETIIDAFKLLNTAGGNAGYLFDTDEVYQSTIRGNFAGQTDNGTGFTREIPRFAIFRNCNGLKVQAQVQRVSEHVLTLGGTSTGSVDIDLQLKDVCLNNGTGTFYPVQLTGTQDKVTVRVQLDTGALTNNTDVIHVGSATVADLKILPSQYPAGWTLTDYEPGAFRLLATMTDETATSIALPGHRAVGRFELALRSDVNPALLSGLYRWNGTVAVMDAIIGANNRWEYTTGALTGTTGTDLKLTASVHTDGKLYVENRLGATVNIYYRWLD